MEIHEFIGDGEVDTERGITVPDGTQHIVVVLEKIEGDPFFGLDGLNDSETIFLGGDSPESCRVEVQVVAL